jgi:hypothetical protein
MLLSRSVHDRSKNPNDLGDHSSACSLERPLPRKDSFTLDMLIDALRAWLYAHSNSVPLEINFLISEYAVYDWVRLGFFTGSRNQEYCQSASRRQAKQRFACIPNTNNAGPWAGQPLAFIAEDFDFYTMTHIRLDPAFSLMNTALDQICELHIRFRFDKSKNNFTIRKYRHQSQAPFDPVIAAINILR